MKNSMKLISVVTLFFISAGALASDYRAYVSTTDSAIKAVVGTSVAPIVTTGTFFGAPFDFDLKVELEAVQDDAVAYLADGEMTENLAEVIINLRPEAFEEGNEKLADEIALGIASIQF